MGHAGYDFPWSMFGVLPLEVSPAYHDYHHSHMMDGNFSGNFSIWDTLLGTNVKYYAHVEKKYAEIETKRA
jgi:sterol desaturase/sphingolipid hydroxylase (fatty acid hydroxylase superfamily)